MLHSRLRRARCLLVVGAIFAGALAMPAVASAAPQARATRHDMPILQIAGAQGSTSPDAASPDAASPDARARANAITYHGGPVILGTTNVYVIWYGNWPASSTTPAILNNLLSHIGGSKYFNINTTYYDGTATHVSNAVALQGSINDNYSLGHSLSDAAVKNVVTNAVTANLLPSDTNALYFVLTSSDVAEPSGFLTLYCGWHDHAAIGGHDLKYSFVGDPSLNLNACSAQTSASPNSNVAADAMASVVAHELEETTTDPDLNAWFDSSGMENADKCAWTFGQTYIANGAKANMKFGTRNYLIQRNWKNTSPGACALKF